MFLGTVDATEPELGLEIKQDYGPSEPAATPPRSQPEGLTHTGIERRRFGYNQNAATVRV